MLSVADVQTMHKSGAQVPSLLYPPAMLNGLKFSKKEKKRNLTITLAFLLLRVFLWPIFTIFLINVLEKKYSGTKPHFFKRKKLPKFNKIRSSPKKITTIATI